VYQPAVRGSCDGRTARMCGKAAMVELWERVHIRHNRGLLGGCNAHTGGETLVGMLQFR
jgi:hypothetical protein